MIKWAQYIENDNCLQQEFHFAVPKTLWKLNMIWNKTRDLFKVKLYTIRSETKKKENCRKEKSCIYSCKVTRLDTGVSKTYTGLTAKTFKERFYGHNATSTTEIKLVPNCLNTFGIWKTTISHLQPNGAYWQKQALLTLSPKSADYVWMKFTTYCTSLKQHPSIQEEKLLDGASTESMKQWSLEKTNKIFHSSIIPAFYM